jgi:hypothetical protein
VQPTPLNAVIGKFCPTQKLTVERMEYRDGPAAIYPIHRVRTGILVNLGDEKYHFQDGSKQLVTLTTVMNAVCFEGPIIFVYKRFKRLKLFLFSFSLRPGANHV